MAYVKFGDWNQARIHLKEALRIKPDFPEAAEAQKALASIGG
jgi:Tfp pilus assembly protein PilF